MKRLVVLACSILMVGIIACAQHDEKAQAEAASEELKELRSQIDSLDSRLVEILAERMRVCIEVGEYKKKYDITVVQNDRFQEILEKRSEQGAQQGLSKDYVKKIFELIHEESVRRQEEIVK